VATALAGKAGSVKINSTPVTTVALINSWNGTLSGAMYDQTSLGDNWTSDVAGLKSFTGSISGQWNVTTDAGQTTLHNAVLNGATVGLNLFTNGTDAYEGTFNIDSFATTDPVNGLVSFTANFRNFGQVFFI
jgi:hypothetical protein